MLHDCVVYCWKGSCVCVCVIAVELKLWFCRSVLKRQIVLICGVNTECVDGETHDDIITLCCSGEHRTGHSAPETREFLQCLRSGVQP